MWLWEAVGGCSPDAHCRIRGKSEGALQTVDGIAISGGVAHNVCLNTRLQMDLQMPVHVPPNPGDGGVALGSLYKVERPAQPHDCRFLAPLLEDRARLDAYSAQWKARPTSAADVAQRLAKGHVGGLLRGQQEFGEIAFGHRSVLAVVTNATSKQRVLRYTGQQSYEYVQVGPVARPLSLRTLTINPPSHGWQIHASFYKSQKSMSTLQLLAAVRHPAQMQ